MHWFFACDTRRSTAYLCTVGKREYFWFGWCHRNNCIALQHWLKKKDRCLPHITYIVVVLSYMSIYCATSCLIRDIVGGEGKFTCSDGFFHYAVELEKCISPLENTVKSPTNFMDRVGCWIQNSSREGEVCYWKIPLVFFLHIFKMHPS